MQVSEFSNYVARFTKISSIKRYLRPGCTKPNIVGDFDSDMLVSSVRVCVQD